ncbi:MAG TPA: molybdenum cofactor guanylyltransferase [Anaerolineales bacterium]|nr:molybdenum cofactor guanylyltransferase [Anaerolineales bacterium]
MLTISIQAGGQSRRMGEDKGLKLFLGRPLIQRVIERVSPLADEIFVTTNLPQDYAFLGVRLVPDLKPGLGSLGGLYTALASASSPFVAAVACDMPFVSVELLKVMVQLIVEKEADVVVAKSAQGLEPLHAVYRRAACLPIIKESLAAGQLRITSWFSLVKAYILEQDDYAAFDPEGRAFWNLNTPEEFAKAERLASINK